MILTPRFLIPVLLLSTLAPCQSSVQTRTKLPSPIPTFTVGGLHTGTMPDFGAVQDAIDAAPPEGAIIRIRPGVYREVIHIDKPNIELRGEGADPTRILIVYDNGASSTCGTFCSATMFVTGDGFHAENLTIANDWGKSGRPRTQAVALQITADRAILRNVRLLGEQDTLMAGSKPCKPAETCHPSRQFFDHCYIEGEVDFIFGNARAAFEDCEIHSVPHAPGGFLTAQSRASAAETSGFVFDHCRLTASPGAGRVFLGRPWRDFATVIFLNTNMGAHIAPAGWSEWHPGETDRLKTATYAEFNSSGPGASPNTREPHSRQLTPAEAAPYAPSTYLQGADHWDPANIK